MRRHLFLLHLIFISACCFGTETFTDAIHAIESENNTKAAQIFAPLAAAGNMSAQYRLGVLYYHGHGVPEDEIQAIVLWKKAAAQGSINAMYELGSAFLFGKQTAKFVPDPDREAATWYFQAASADHADAQYYLGLLFLAGKGVAENRTEAARWMRKAAAQGHPEAMKALIRIDSGK
jgi:TPR repeat protein